MSAVLSATAAPDIAAAFERIQELWDRAQSIWFAGGWAMLAIAINALAMFAIGVHIWLALREKGFLSVPEKRWRLWIASPTERRGPIGALLERVVTDERSLSNASKAFDGVRSGELAPFERDLRFMRIAVSTAPLLGLFGTVTGMLATFGALATGSGGEQTMGMIAKGISEALITTETGLVIALPGLFFQYQLTRTFERYKAFLAKVESAIAQRIIDGLKQGAASATSGADRPALAADERTPVRTRLAYAGPRTHETN